MQSIIMISESRELLSDIRTKASGIADVGTADDGSVSVEMELGRVYVSADDRLRREYDSAELDIISHAFPVGAHFYLACFSNERAMRNLLSEVSFCGEVYVDDDMGSIVPLAEFLS